MPQHIYNWRCASCIFRCLFFTVLRLQMQIKCHTYLYSLSKQAPILSIIWGLKDSTLFISQDASIYSVGVQEELPSLQYLCRSTILDDLLGGSEKEMESLPLPWMEVEKLRELKAPAIPVRPLHILISSHGQLFSIVSMPFCPSVCRLQYY